MKKPKILLACEFSGVVRDAFLAKDCDAWSCDIIPTETPGPHLQCDVLTILDDGWDLMIAFPPCTCLCVSGARYFAQKRQDGSQQQAVDFFMALANANIPKICIENPVGIMSTRWRKPDQIIQPFEFGHPESKKTCFWLKNLPKLTPTNILPTPSSGRWYNQTPSGQSKLGPSKNRAKIRSTTYEGVGKAMADQWAGLLK